MKSDPNIHHRRSIRLQGYDYTQPGLYFVTLVAHARRELFGQIINEKMHLSPLGKIVRDEWIQSNRIRKEISLFEDEFIVMPNHIHGIVNIIETAGLNNTQSERNDRLEKGGRRPPQLIRFPKSLGSFIAGFKSAVTSRSIKELDLFEVWQRDYYDHIIRSEKEYDRIWNYINDNPRRWAEDQLHPGTGPNPFNTDINRIQPGVSSP